MAAGAAGLSLSADDPCAHAGQGPGCCLIRQLRLTQVDEGRFTGGLRGGRSDPDRAFGGGLLAQAVLAAGATAQAGQAPSSLHAYFVSAGDTGRPMRYTVGRLGAGRSSALRQVTADQDGVTRLVVLVSFRRFGGNGAHHQRQAPALGSPPSLAAGPGIGPGIGPEMGSACRCDIGDLTCGVALQAAVSEAEPGAAPGAHRASWLRLRHDLGARPLWQAAGLAYVSDLATIRTVDQPHRGEPVGAWPRQSTMRCGSTGRSASMSGCGTGSAARCTPAGGGPASASSTTPRGAWSRPAPRRSHCGMCEGVPPRPEFRLAGGARRLYRRCGSDALRRRGASPGPSNGC